MCAVTGFGAEGRGARDRVLTELVGDRIADPIDGSFFLVVVGIEQPWCRRRIGELRDTDTDQADGLERACPGVKEGSGGIMDRACLVGLMIERV